MRSGLDWHGFIGGLRHELRRLIREDGDVIALLLGFIFLTGGVAWALGLQDRFSIFIYPEVGIQAVLYMVFILFFLRGAWLILIVRPDRPISIMVSQARRLVLKAGPLRIVFVMMMFSFFLSAVSSFKTLIPAINPYRWDLFLAELDKALHGGRQPWEWVQPFIRGWELTQVINFLYNLWFFVVVGSLAWMIVDMRHPAARKQYLISYASAWMVNGTALALYFSSGGPCYFGRLLPNLQDPFSGLMLYLGTANQGSPAWAVKTQDYLWSIYEQQGFAVGSGISAMPSMHVSLAWLLFLLAARAGFFWGLLALVYVLVILLGSVHLGWHYLVDGYVSIFTTSIIWILAGAWSRRAMTRIARKSPERGVPAISATADECR